MHSRSLSLETSLHDRLAEKKKLNLRNQTAMILKRISVEK